MSQNSPQHPSQAFSFESSIPVIRMLDEAKTKAFYVDYLGYEVDWEHRFSPDASSPLYMQIHQGDSVLHLNGHAGEEDPVCEVRIPVHGVEAYCQYLCNKNMGDEKPSVVDPRYKGKNTDMNLLDPSGNHLVFWAVEDKG